jgi:hypothetical protein
VADLVGVARSRAEPQRQVPTEIGPEGGDGEPGRRQQPPVARPSARPRGQRAEEQRGRTGLEDGVSQAHPLLVGVQRRPVGQPGDRGGRAARHPGRDQHPGGAIGAAEQVKQHRGGPAAERQPDQCRVCGLAERDAVQGIGSRARGQRSHNGTGQLSDYRIEGMRTFDAFGQDGRPGEQGRLAGLVRPAACGDEGKPHPLCVPADGGRVAYLPPNSPGPHPRFAGPRPVCTGPRRPVRVRAGRRRAGLRLGRC